MTGFFAFLALLGGDLSSFPPPPPPPPLPPCIGNDLCNVGQDLRTDLNFKGGHVKRLPRCRQRGDRDHFTCTADGRTYKLTYTGLTLTGVRQVR